MTSKRLAVLLVPVALAHWVAPWTPELGAWVYRRIYPDCFTGVIAHCAGEMAPVFLGVYCVLVALTCAAAFLAAAGLARVAARR